MTESVWDYPRPPRVEACARRARVEFAGETVADSDRALRVLETSTPPTIYIPLADVRMELLRESDHHTVCEWKGRASYYDLVAGGRTAPAAAWYYPEPYGDYLELRGHVAFYPGRADACWLGDERVTPQESDFYGGWVTAEIEGPFKN